MTLMSFRQHLSRRRARRPAKFNRRLEVEVLEERALLSTIQWTNRGSAMNDSDRFNAVFGANADVARADVDAALRAWQNVITSFNYSSEVMLNDTYSVSVSMSMTTGFGASASPTAQVDGK